MICEVAAVTHHEVRFRRLRRDGGLVKEVHRQHRELFEQVCVQRWVQG